MENKIKLNQNIMIVCPNYNRTFMACATDEITILTVGEMNYVCYCSRCEKNEEVKK